MKETEHAAAGFSGYTKEQLLASNRFKDRRDVLSVVLSSEASYSVPEAEELIDKFMKGKVE